MSYKYWLPGEEGQINEYETDSNAVIIIGANGSGKSKLGAWIEQQSFLAVHRVGAQRNLNFNENIQLKSYTEAENFVFYGRGNAGDLNKNHRWNFGHYTTKLMDDFDNVLSALIAKRNNEVSEFHKKCMNAGNDKNLWPNVPKTSLDKLIEIWSSVLPQRKLIEDDSRFYTVFNKNGNEEKYSSTEMSDGERAVLYLAAQVLCVPENKLLIIDEPEIHLHRSIIRRLWKTLERQRKDCLFIYITHDLNFATTHGNADIIWVKAFDGVRWELEMITGEGLPEELTLEILGSRKNVIFVEGESNSFDYQLYMEIFRDYLIIPCGGCTQVIARTRAFRNNHTLHDYEVYGLIDRDYRSEHEIESLRNDGIFTLEVAEVENLFLVEELIRFMALRFGVPDAETTVAEVENFVIDTKFSNMIERQICQSVVAEIKYQLKCIEIEKKNEAEAKASLQDGLSAIDFDDIRNKKEPIFRDALNKRDYKAVLKVFNEKGIAKSIGRIMGVDNNEYQQKVINLLRGDSYNEIAGALRKYLPTELSVYVSLNNSQPLIENQVATCDYSVGSAAEVIV